MKPDEGSRRCLHSWPVSRLPVPTFFPLLVIFFLERVALAHISSRQVPSDHFGGGGELAPAPDWRKQMTQEPVGRSRLAIPLCFCKRCR